MDDIGGMKNNIYAALMHVATDEINNYHWRYCPAGPDSWCKYQCDQANNTNLYKPGKGLHQQVLLDAKKVFLDLSKDDLLSRCLHGKTQNQNESFNAIIWNQTPKQRFVKFETFDMAIHDAVIHLNIGGLGTLFIFDVRIERRY